MYILFVAVDKCFGITYIFYFPNWFAKFVFLIVPTLFHISNKILHNVRKYLVSYSCQILHKCKIISCFIFLLKLCSVRSCFIFLLKFCTCKKISCFIFLLKFSTMYDNHVSYFCLNLAQCTTISSVYETELKWVSVIYPIKSIKEIFKFYINSYTNLYKSSTSCLLNIYMEWMWSSGLGRWT